MSEQRSASPAESEAGRLQREAAALRGEVARLRQALAAAPLDGEDRLRAIVESAVDYAIITADLDGCITS